MFATTTCRIVRGLKRISNSGFPPGSLARLQPVRWALLVTDRRMSATQESQGTPPLTCLAPNSNRSLLVCSSHQKRDARAYEYSTCMPFSSCTHTESTSVTIPALRESPIASGISGSASKPNGGQIDVAFVQPRLRVRRQPSHSRQEALLQVPLLARRRLACAC